MSSLWPSARAEDLLERARALATQQTLPFSFHVNPVVSKLRYFPDDLGQELAHWAPEPFFYVPPSHKSTDQGVIHIFHSIGVPGDAAWLWALRESMGPRDLIVSWMWDHHTAYVPNLKTSLASDFVVYSHSNHSAYLHTPTSVIAGHIPLCSAQWEHHVARNLFHQCAQGERQHTLLMNYVHYDFAPKRNAALATIREHIKEAHTVIMPANDRSRYFMKTPLERFEEWARHKATIILPMNDDLSTRVFDALLAGLVPVIPSNITDFDLLVPPAEQASLGIVRIDSYELDELKAGAQLALQTFDDQGRDGMLARHHYALENHLLINRITGILYFFHQFVTGDVSLEFGEGNSGCALYPVPATKANA